MTLTDERVARWKGWIEGPIHNDIIGMHDKRQIWRDVIGMVEANPEVANTPSAFWDWMRETYSTSQAIAIRRQADRDYRACSLTRLIEQMRDDAPSLTRAYFLSLWDVKEDPLLMRRAEDAFDALAGGGDHLDPEVPRSDLARLRSEAGEMTRYVNEHVAHDMAEPTMVQLPTFNDMHDAIDALGTMLRKYSNLLTAGTYITLEPTVQEHWMAIFRQPWIAPSD